MTDEETLAKNYDRYYRMEIANEYSVIYAECRPLAEKGDALAQFYVGLCYYFGYGGVEENPAEAYDWFCKSARQGFFDGYFGVAITEVYSGATEEVKAEGRKALRHLAQQGNPRAQCELGTCYYEGKEGFKKNVQKAVDWWAKAMEQSGFYVAFYNLALCLLHDDDDDDDDETNEKSKEKTIRWALETLEELCEQGHVPSLYELGWCYSHGHYLPKNDAKAAELWAEGVRHQSSKCAYVLGMSYFLGQGVKRDETTGMNLLRAAAMSGNKDAIDVLNHLAN